MKLNSILFILFLFVVSISTLKANSVVKKVRLPLPELLQAVKPIEKFALNIGHGKSDVYVFLDPICPNSQNFLEMISSMQMLQKKYSYHIFLYELKRFDSLSTIERIYESSNVLQSIKTVMIEKKTLPKSALTVEVKEKISAIAQVAKKIDVYKRPYLIINKKR